MTSVLTDSLRDITVIPFSLWSAHSVQAAALANAELPHLRAWFNQARCVQVQVDQWQEQPQHGGPLAPLSPPHERAWAQAMDWPLVDGGLPFAAWAAQGLGLATGWAFVTLCHWQVSNGQVIMGDPADLHIDAQTDTTLLNAMRPFFAEDGIALYPYKAGQWLAQSPLFVDLPTASLDRVMGRHIDPWLVGGHSPSERLSPAAQLLRRLQNEMQMLLYTHPVNDGRGLAINSFWLHGTGALPSQTNAPRHLSEPVVMDDLRRSAVQQDLLGWLAAWQQLDAHVIAPVQARVAAGVPQRLVLCGEHEFRVYDSAAFTWWQRLRQQLRPISFDTLLAAAPLKD